MIVEEELSRYFSALIFFVICTTVYVFASLRLIKRRVQGTDATFNLPYRGEALFHLVSLILISGALAFAMNYSQDSVDESTLRIFEYFSYFGTGIIAVTWINFFVITVYGPESAQEDIDITLRGRTFMKAPDWLEENNHDNY